MNDAASQLSHPIRLLIVEDEFLIAESLRMSLEDEGFEVVGVAGKLEKALSLIEQGSFDAAIIDANLMGVSTGPAALRLKALGLPFVVLSGYSQDQLDMELRGGAFVRKPYQLDNLMRCLRQIAGRAVPQA